MFCSECGKENQKGAKFCEDCGAELISNATEVKKSIPKKPMDKKTKTLIGIVSLIVILLIMGCVFLGSKSNPTSIAKEYFLAYVNGDKDRLYKYLDVKDSGFTSKKIFKKVFEFEKKDLLNYSVASEEKSGDGLTSKVKINYTLRGESTSKSVTINLVKDKKNKFLLFDNWKISNETSALVTDYRVNVPKGSTVKFEGVTLDKKYLQQDYSETYDSYVIPQILKGKYNVSVTLKNNLVLEGDTTVRNYGSSNLTNLNISDNEKAKIEKQLPNIISLLYQSAIEKKAFNDIRKNFEYDGANLNDLERAYGLFMSSIGFSGLTKFTVTDAKVSRTKMSGSYITAVTKVNYEYTVTKSLFGEEKTNTKKDSTTMYFDFDYVNGEYKLVDISSMPKYFSVF